MQQSLEEKIVSLREELAKAEQKLIQRNHINESRRIKLRSCHIDELIERIIELEDDAK